MAQAGSIRFERGVLAAVVLLAHVLLVWVIIQARLHISERETTAEPVFATLIDQPRFVPLAASPVVVRTEPLQHLQTLAPKLPDIPEEMPEPIANVETAPIPAPSTVAPAADRGESGANSASSGGGRALSIVQRVVPKYPFASMRTGEQGAAVVRVRVDELGRVVDVKIGRSSGFSRLDRAALDAVRKWKFTPAARGSAPEGTWGETELRFTLYRFTYSRLSAQALDEASAERVRSGASDEAAPGSEAALKRFIADVLSGAITGDPDPQTRSEVTRLKAALREWGEVKSVQFSGGAAPGSWARSDVNPQFRDAEASVEVHWDMYEVRQQHATLEWLIAVDRKGTLWTARVGLAPTQ